MEKIACRIIHRSLHHKKSVFLHLNISMRLQIETQRFNLSSWRNFNDRHFSGGRRANERDRETTFTAPRTGNGEIEEMPRMDVEWSETPEAAGAENQTKTTERETDTVSLQCLAHLKHKAVPMRDCNCRLTPY